MDLGVPLDDEQVALIQTIKKMETISFSGDAVDSAKIAAIGARPEVDAVVLADRELDSVTLDWLASLPRLRQISLYQCRATVDSLERPRAFPALLGVKITDGTIPPKTLETLAAEAPSLAWVDLEKTPLPVDTLERLIRAPNFVRLTTKDIPLPPETIDVLRLHGHRLKSLELSGSGLAGQAIVDAVLDWPDFEEVRLDLDLPWSGRRGPMLFRRKRLDWIRWRRAKNEGRPIDAPTKRPGEDHTLHVGGAPFDDALAIEIMGRFDDWSEFAAIEANIGRPTLEEVARHPQTYRLTASGTRITDDDLELLARLPRLRDVDLSHCPVTDAGVAKLVQACPRLKELRLTGTKITDRSAEEFAKLRLLETLDVRETSVTREALRPLEHRPLSVKAWSD